MSNPKHLPPKVIRIAVVLSILGVILAGVVLNADIGTLCSWCPIGFAQVSLAAQGFLPALIVPFIVVVALALVFGRAFCAWGCPSSLVKKNKSQCQQCAQGITEPSVDPAGKQTLLQSPALHNILLIVVVLAASFLVGFPVFCLFCPIGLVFGFFFALFRSLTIYQPSWDLLIFPAMLFIEFRLLKSWCSRICPLGALFSIAGHLSRFRIRPRSNKEVCRVGEGCHACADACPEAIEAEAIGTGANETCTLCLECRTACPQHALHTFSLPQQARGEESEQKSNEK